MKDIEPLRRLMETGLSLGEGEIVKRQADALFEAGGDPISFLASVVRQSDPASLSWQTAREVLGSLDSAVLRALDGASLLPSVGDERPKRCEVERRYKDLVRRKDKMDNRSGSFLLRVDNVDLKPCSIDEIKALCLSGAISAVSLARSSIVERNRTIPAIEHPQLQPVILEISAAMHGPSSTRQDSGSSQPGLLRRLKCRIGRHLGQHWRFLDEVSCRAVSVCAYCGKPFNEHWRHLRGILGYRDENSCSFGKFCLRCNSFKETEEKHVWADWSYAHSSSCRQNRICIRCGKEDARTATHDFVVRELSACLTERKCARCGEAEFLHDHRPGPWSYSSPVSCWASQYCLRCLEEIDSTLMHHWKERQDPETYRYYKKCARCDAEEYS